MEIHLTRDPEAFAAEAAAFLASEPISANVIAVVLARTIDGALIGTPDDVWITAVDHGRIIGAAMCNTPYNLFLARTSETVARQIAITLNDRGRELPGVTGEASGAAAFAQTWQELTGQGSVVQIAHHAYRLGHLVLPTHICGVARLAAPSDTVLVASWLDAFHDEALAHDPVVDSSNVAAQRIDAREVWLWEHAGRPVALTACSRPAAGVARIGPVYTPPADRRHGHATGSTAAAIQAALDQGAAHLMLYADQANSTSNALYRRLGFHYDHDALDLGFRAGREPFRSRHER